MTKNTLTTLMILFVAAASFWFFSLKKDLNKTREVLLEQNQQSAPIDFPRVNRQVVSTFSPQPEFLIRQKELQENIQKAQSLVEEDRQKIAAEAERIADLKSRLPQVNSQNNLSSLIEQNNDRIQDLLENIRDSRQAQTELSRRAEVVLQLQDSQIHLAVEQLNQDIRTQQTMIQQTRESIVYWMANNGYAVEQQAHLDELQALLDAQTQRLQELQDQRSTIAQSVLLQTQSMQGQVEQASADFSDEQGGISEEVSSLRAQIQQLRQQQNFTRTSSVGLSSQITQMQKEYDTDAAAFRTHSESLAKLQEELRQLH